MAKIINITNKLDNEKTLITIGDKSYEVKDELKNIMKFEELLQTGDINDMAEGIKAVLGEKAVKEINVLSMKVKNLKVLVIAIMAATQDMEYEEAEKRFQESAK